MLVHCHRTRLALGSPNNNNTDRGMTMQTTLNRLFSAGLALAAFVACAHPAVAQDSGESMEAMMARINQMPDTPGDGPHPALTEVVASLPEHVVYRPANLAAVAPGSLGVFIWGNGGCAVDGTSSRFHLAQIASYGYLVIAPGQWRSGPNAIAGPDAPRVRNADGTMPPPPTTSADLTEALDWAMAENARPGSPLYGLIDADAVAVGGFSCGGLQALEVAADPRWRTVVVQNSGILNDPAMAIPGMEQAKSLLETLHTPVLYLLGGETDIAYPNGIDDFARIGHVPATMVNLPVGHGGTYNEPMGGRAAMIVVDWLEWQLRGDNAAGRSFQGANCRLCTDAEATIAMQNWP